jgi:hypothetical protein
MASERACRLRSRAFAAVHVDGKPEYDPNGLAIGAERKDTRSVERKFCPHDGLNPRGEAAVGIADGNANGFGAEVETDQGAAAGQQRRHFDEWEDGRGHGEDLSRSHHARQLRQLNHHHTHALS